MSIYCMICGQPENWSNGKEYDFDDTVRIDIIDEFGNKKNKWTRYAHARCILKMLKKSCSEYVEIEDSIDKEDDFYELKKMIKESKKRGRNE